MKANFSEHEQNNLFNLMQNSALSVIALHGFVCGYFNVAKHKDDCLDYPPLSYMFYVLPIVYNNDSLQSFKSCNQLYTAISKDNSIILGLQERANKMSVQTFDSLNLAFSKKILSINKNEKTIEIMQGFKSRTLPLFLSMNSTNNSVQEIRDCAFRLGGVFAKRDEKNIQLELNIRF